MRTTLGPRRPMGGNQTPQTQPASEPSMEATQAPDETKQAPPPTFRAYQSAIRRHEEALARINRKTQEAPPSQTDPS